MATPAPRSNAFAPTESSPEGKFPLDGTRFGRPSSSGISKSQGEEDGVTEPFVVRPDRPIADLRELDLRQLFALNILLQLVDGMLTYRAELLGFHEANPLVSASMGTLGLGPALLLFKAQACGFLVLLRWKAPPTLGALALWSTALGYSFLAVVPWLGKFLAFSLN
jgi:hypothetical protein